MTREHRSTRAAIREQEAKLSDLITELAGFGDDVSCDLAERLNRCQAERRARRSMSNPGCGWLFRCRSAACWSCRRPIVSSWQQRARKIFANAESEECSFATVVLARCSTLYPLQNVVTKLRRDLRNVRDAMAREHQTWNSVSLIGHVELDAVAQYDIPLLPPIRRTLLPQLPVLGGVPDEVVWVPHCHICIHHPQVQREYVRHALSAQWSSPNQVHVQEFDASYSAEDNAANCTGYTLKFRDSTMFGATMFAGSMVIDWPTPWVAHFWSWLHSRRRGLQPLQVAVGKRTSRVERMLAAAVAETSQQLEPMPVVV